MLASGVAMRRTVLTRTLATIALALLLLPVSAFADALSDPSAQWLPSSDGAQWTYEWSDSAYARTPTRERYTVALRDGPAFRLAWTTDGLGNAAGAVTSAGTMDFRRTAAGTVNQNWTGVSPPLAFPVLCSEVSGCGNSLAGALYLAIWGSRTPVLPEPLLQGAEWTAVGGVSSDVSSANRYLGRRQIVVPAFPKPVTAVLVSSDITQGGALGDPYGSGRRTVWWVRGVGPVRIVLRHQGGEVSQADLVATSLRPQAPPPDTNYFPLVTGRTQVFRWRNSRHMKAWSTQSLQAVQSVNGTTRVDVKALGGPIKVAGSYVFSARTSGVTNLSASTSAATSARFPGLGPLSQPVARRRHFFTPFDLMTYGFNPLLEAAPRKGQTWKASVGGRDYEVFGVTGRATVLGIQRVHTPAGTFRALAVQATLKQRGVPFGSGTRTSWFAPGRGLVALRFRHGDGSVSTVERVR